VRRGRSVALAQQVFDDHQRLAVLSHLRIDACQLQFERRILRFDLQRLPNFLLGFVETA
jgi:hypothetical protein